MDRPACRLRLRVRRPLSSARGNPALVLCQRPQKSLLLSRLWPGRRSAALCPVVTPSVLSRKLRLPRTAKCSCRRRCHRARASRHFLSKPTRSLPRGTRLSPATRTTQSRHDPRTADWLRPRRELAPASHRSRLFFRSATASRLAQCAGPRCLLPASGLPLLDRKSTRLNSSHTVISYAVFCLKKKKK